MNDEPTRHMGRVRPLCSAPNLPDFRSCSIDSGIPCTAILPAVGTTDGTGNTRGADQIGGRRLWRRGLRLGCSCFFHRRGGRPIRMGGRGCRRCGLGADCATCQQTTTQGRHQQGPRFCLYVLHRISTTVCHNILPISKLQIKTPISRPGPTGQRARLQTYGGGMILPSWFNFLSFWATIGRRSRLQSMQTRGKRTDNSLKVQTR